MDNQNTEAHDLIVKAREALRRGDKESAHALAEQAALQAPDMEDAWLVLTVSEPNPEDSLAYAQQALEINPSSERALKAVEWAIARLKQAQAGAGTGSTAEAVAAGATAAPVAPVAQETTGEPKKSNAALWIFAAALIALLLCVAVVYLAYTGLTKQPTFSNIIHSVSIAQVAPTEEKHWALVELPKPAAPFVGTSAAPAIGTSAPLQDILATPTAQASLEPLTPAATEAAPGIPTETPTPIPSQVPNQAPSQAPTETATAIAQITETPGALAMEIMADTPTSAYVAPTSSGPSSAPLPNEATSGNGARWIDVDLTNQHVYAYEGQTVVNSFIVSTGTWQHPTVTGQYHIYVKYRSAPMSGPGYYLPNVPYIMYFYKGYGLHGTYWHHNFGTPMSHGCVNLKTDEAAWLYSWASVGTLVNVHY